MASPRKFSEKIALMNQKEAEDVAKFDAIMREVSDVTSRAASNSSVGTSPTGAGSSPGEPPRPLSVKSAGASPPQCTDNHLHINLGQQYRAGGSLPNVNNKTQKTPALLGVGTSVAIHSIDLKTALNNLEEMQQNQAGYRQGVQGPPNQQQLPQQQQQQHQQQQHQQQQQPHQQQHTERQSRSMGLGPMRSRPSEKRHDTSPYSGVPYLSPPLMETWRRTNSDSALHQSANEACHQTNSSHRRGSDACQLTLPYFNYPNQRTHSSSNAENPHNNHGFIERPRSSCDMPRVPGINVYPSSQPPGQQIPIIGNNTGSLPDLSNVHFPAPLHTPLDQEDHSSGSQYSNSPQTGSPTALSPTSLAQAKQRLSLTQEHSSSRAQNHLTVPVNHRYLPSCKGLTMENNTSTSQQDVRINYSQQQVQQHQQQQQQHQQQQQQQHQQQVQNHAAQVQQQAQTSPQNQPVSTSPGLHQAAHSPGHYNVYQQPCSPLPPASPNSQQSQLHQQNLQTNQQFNSLSYRNSQMVNRPSPQSSPSLTFQGSPLSYSNNPSAPSSPASLQGAPTLSLDPADQIDQNVYNQVHADFEHFSMDWAQMMQQLEDTTYSFGTPLDEMDSPAAIAPYMNSPSHSGTYNTQSDILSVASELASGDGGYFSTSPLQHLAYNARTPVTTQQLTPQTPNTPTITLTDCSLGPDDLVNSDFGKDFVPSIAATFGAISAELFPDDPLSQDLSNLHQEELNALRQTLDPLDLDDLQRLTNSDMVISDTTEADFRLEQS